MYHTDINISLFINSINVNKFDTFMKILFKYFTKFKSNEERQYGILQNWDVYLKEMNKSW